MPVQAKRWLVRDGVEEAFGRIWREDFESLKALTAQLVHDALVSSYKEVA